MGTVLTEQGLLEDAVQVYATALELAPEDPALYLNLAILYYRAEQYEDALSYIREILGRHPEMFEAQRMVGDIAVATGDHDLAVEAYSLALRIRAGDPEVLHAIATSLEALDRKNDARDYWERWLDSVAGDPNYEPEANRIVEHLNELSNS